MKTFIDLKNEARSLRKEAQKINVKSEYYHYAIKRIGELDEQIKQMAMMQERVYTNSQIGNYKNAMNEYIKKGKRDITEIIFTYIQVFKYIALPVLILFLLLYSIFN